MTSLVFARTNAPASSTPRAAAVTPPSVHLLYTIVLIASDQNALSIALHAFTPAPSTLSQQYPA